MVAHGKFSFVKYIQQIAKYVMLAALLYMPLFGFLDRLPIRDWDESRLAHNAYEMYKNNNYIVTHYEGSPDLWNTKPPLMIWLQTGFMHLVGPNELAVRLPSAFAALFTVIVLMLFSQRYLKSFWFGFIAVMVLITTFGYVDYHATRTGDYDALLTLFTTMSGLSLFLFSETRKNLYLYLLFIGLTLAVITKSINGLLFTPALLIYMVYRREVLILLKSKHFYIGLGIFVMTVASYYLLREYLNPGYLEAVVSNELGGRYLNTLDNHQHGFFYYYQNIIDTRLSYWHIMVPCGIAVGLFSKNQKIMQITRFSTLMTLTFFLVISFSKTKLPWYDVPLFPFLALLVAVFVFYLFELLAEAKIFRRSLEKNLIPYLFLFLVMVTPYQVIYQKTYLPTEYSNYYAYYEISHYLQRALKGKEDLEGRYLLYEGYHAHHTFYINILKDKGVNTGVKSWRELAAGDDVFTDNEDAKEYIDAHYDHVETGSRGNIQFYQILTVKTEAPDGD